MERNDIAIRAGGLDDPQVIALLHEHLAGMHALSPPESIHALGLDALRQPAITFWSAWQGDLVLGCGALKEIDPRHGEIKSMRTAATHLRKGVATTLLRHVIDQAALRGYRRLSLETGSAAGFAPARRLYAAFGFGECGPFADYVADANSVFMTRTP